MLKTNFDDIPPATAANPFWDSRGMSGTPAPVHWALILLRAGLRSCVKRSLSTEEGTGGGAQIDSTISGEDRRWRGAATVCREPTPSQSPQKKLA